MLDFSNNLSERMKNSNILDCDDVQDGAKELNEHENGDSNLLKKKIHKYSFEKDKLINTQSTNRSVRKLCEKAIKTLKIKMSDFSAQVNKFQIINLFLPIVEQNFQLKKIPKIDEDKQVVKEWLKKKLEKSEILDQVTQKGKLWLINCMVNLDYQKYFEIAQKYLKKEELEFNINVLKKNPKELQFFEFPLAVTLYNQPPGSKLEDNTDENLGLIDIKIPLEYILREPDKFIKEQFIWDLDQFEVGLNFKNLTILILDFLNELYPHNLKQATTNEILATVQVCYLQLHYALENQRKIKKSWQQLLRSDFERDQEDIHLDGVIPIKIQIQRKYKENILWDTNNNLNFADSFARGWVFDQGLDPRYALYVSSQIRKQVMKFCEKRLDKLVFLFNDLTEGGDIYKQQQEIHSRAYELLKELPSYKNLFICDSQMTISQDLSLFLKRNSEFLPQNIATLLGVHQKEENHDVFVDIQDINQSNQHNIQPNTYLDREIFKQIEQGYLSKDIKS